MRSAEQGVAPRPGLDRGGRAAPRAAPGRRARRAVRWAIRRWSLTLGLGVVGRTQSPVPEGVRPGPPLLAALYLGWLVQGYRWSHRVFGTSYRLTTRRLLVDHGHWRPCCWMTDLAEIREVTAERSAFSERLRACYPDRPFVWKANVSAGD